MSDDYKRSSDSVILQVHGMLERIDQKMDDALSTLSNHIESDEKRFRPVEELNTFIRVSVKIIAGIAAVGGIGGIVAWLRWVASTASGATLPLK